MAAWLEGRISGKQQWTSSLYSLKVSAPELTFVAGQFARLALPAPAGSKEPMVGRPYSFVNPPHESPHEFYFNVVPGGPLSARLAGLEEGEMVWLAPRANGFFSISELPGAQSLWCISTGTGIGPFLSMLRTDEPWTKFAHVVLVHAVRRAEDLTYRDVIDNVVEKRDGAFTYVPIVSREEQSGTLHGRIPALIVDGQLEARAGVALAPESAHAMLCGNPAMVEDVQDTLARRGMRRHRRKEPGHITLETYW
jgi:ferredoxin--NADP+ reductase